ncbi:ORF6N domain-containing protein [bacterium]|nr:ORF6N domain-containing protein [bacterium]
MSGSLVVSSQNLPELIYTIRGIQVMLDHDLASLYGVETRRLNEQVKRNVERFPLAFRFQLTEGEYDSLRSQNATIKTGRGQHRKYMPYVFTEQGVAMLSAVLKSETAVKVSVEIMNAFVNMRRFLSTNAQVFERLDTLELKQAATDEKVENVLKAIESKQIQPKQGIFFDGQVFDAYKFVSDLIRTAKKSIVLIDNYVDDSVLTLFSKRRKNVKLTILSKTVSKQLKLDVKKYNAQYPPVDVQVFTRAHDRFLIVDDSVVYHFGASLKDLGKKWFAFSKMDFAAVEMLKMLEGCDG